ncbi:ATP-dependent DNA helicase DinG [Bhargavaea ullalensis]|uniref:3'-5' exonuclease DinG n=2 Tax=Bhargavaea ullalensis TaxID=1265685 RepID=A0ABV2GA61_9BACL
MLGKRYAVVDLESTGNSPKNGDRIIEIGIVIVEDGNIARTYSTFLNPEKRIPAFISSLTGISDRDVSGAPKFEERAAEIRRLLDGCIFVAHNVSFDLPFLQQEFRRAGQPKWTGQTIDTVELAKIVSPSAASFKLQDIAADFGVTLHNAHRAVEDATATARLLLHLFERLDGLPEETLSALHKRSFRLKTDLSPVFFDALKKRRSAASSAGHSTWRGIALREPSSAAAIPAEANYPESAEEKNSLLRNVFPDYEQRPAQLAMMDEVHFALENGGEVAIEAATGIGKTFAYLLPAAVRAIEAGRPAVISTYTNHLTEQILEREAGKVSGALQTPVRAVLLKGLNHYIDLERFAGILETEDESYDETLAVLQVLVWLAETETGDLEELNVSGGGSLFIDKIRKYRASTQQADAGHYDFFLRSVRAAAQASLIVTNHAMLLSDADRLEPLLGNISGLVIDEAHQFLPAARTRAEIIFSYTDWKYTVGQIGRPGDGLLHDRFSQLAGQVGKPGEREIVRMGQAYEVIMNSFDRAFAAIQSYIQSVDEKSHEQKKIFALNDMAPLLPVCAGAGESLYAWLDIAGDCTRLLEQAPDAGEQESMRFLAEWKHWLREITLQAAGWMELFDDWDGNEAAWAEADMRSLPGSLKIVRQPAVVSGLIRRSMDRFRETGVVWTSGTMTLPGKERFIADSLGLPQEVPVKKFEAPPDFYKGAKLYVVNDMPDILNVSQLDYIEAVADAVVQTVIATGGRCFVLFTSHDMLRKTFELISDSELLAEYMLIAQGITPGSRMRLLKSFQRFSNSVLFGTDSFWEGVDAPGDALAAVVVVRLPFSSPDNPVFKARAAVLAAEGKNPFSELSLPAALLKFRQGFGRLIRSSSDRGAYIVLDRRIEKKSYGKEFLQALPSVPMEKVALADMVLELESWYNGGV